MNPLAQAETVTRQPRWRPRWGWHDDHRFADGTDEYLPAVQQVRGEFAELYQLIERTGLLGGRCLQLGMGECDASHEVWRALFRTVVTIDRRVVAIDDERLVGMDTSNPEALLAARVYAPYDFLFIDADHGYEGVRSDHETYGPLGRPGGLIAFHDALPRDGYPEVEVWKHLLVLSVPMTVIGNEVGVAVIRA